MNQPKPAYLVASAILPHGHGSLMDYAQAAMPIFKAYGAEVLVAGNSEQKVDLLEGRWPGLDAKLSLVRFPSMQHLKDCLNSNEYLVIKHLRTDIIDSNFSVAID
ncbi:DUF1330 domain-containing protein [Photobacterium sp. SDRW27]|uniref:DUF1330 domain-containing protein n=1 Tax=Photobacterium obscurum TaxID=2829490 RepID=UPI0022431DBC|nr:DUF1330 domain-containing protein [Photobacterium obscurum]MCW8329232.1 DUF1330 domain-containing protein [Photobacterium obscurum]